MIEPIIKEIKSLSYVEEINYQGNLIKKIEGAYKRISRICSLFFRYHNFYNWNYYL